MENDGGQIGNGPDDNAPRADEVLSQKRAEQAARSFMPDQNEQLAALKAEVERLRESIGQIAPGTSQIASAELKELASVAEKKLKENVFLSVGIAAAIGYLWGRSGR